MLVKEERAVLQFLSHHSVCSLKQIIADCLPGTPPQLTERILENLAWFGYVIVFPNATGRPDKVQITARGKALV